MIEEPYRWLEAIANRREYIETQLRGGSPAFAVSLREGILLLGVGTGHSKVFELFDRQAMAGLGHPADLERIRQSLIDAAHLEAFTRSPFDVSLRRLVSFGLGPQLKTAFEQVFAAPILVRLILAEVADHPDQDLLATVNYDGSFELQPGGIAIVADTPEAIPGTQEWLASRLSPDTAPQDAAGILLTAWRHLTRGDPLPESVVPEPAEPQAEPPGPGARQIEVALLRRASDRAARYLALKPMDLGLNARPSTPT